MYEMFLFVFLVLFSVEASFSRMQESDKISYIKDILDRLTDLESEVFLQNRQIKQLKDNENLLMERIGILESKTCEMNRSETDLSKTVAPQKDVQFIQVNKREVSGAVAFYAYMSSGEPNPGQHHTLEFDHVVTNVGNSYNKYTGVFSVPVSGIYVLTLTLSGSPSTQVPVEFIQNNNVLGSVQLYASARSVDTNPTVTTTIIVQLVKGDSCFVRTSSTYTAAGEIYSTDLSRSSFSGWLVSPKT